MPANMNHFAFTRQETIIMLFGQGPVEFKYVNPADDPRLDRERRTPNETAPADVRPRSSGR